jgi:hypothetical protein
MNHLVPPSRHGVRPPPRARRRWRACPPGKTARLDAAVAAGPHRPSLRRDGDRHVLRGDPPAARRPSPAPADRRGAPFRHLVDHGAGESLDPPRPLERSRQGARWTGHAPGRRCHRLRAAVRVCADRDCRQGDAAGGHQRAVAIAPETARRLDKHLAQSPHLAVFHPFFGRDAAHPEHRLGLHPGDRPRRRLLREPRGVRDHVARRVLVPDAIHPRWLRRRDVPPHLPRLGHG